MPAPAFALASTGAGTVALADLLARGPAVVMFVTDDCPTCELALRRLAAAGAAVTVVCEAPAAARRPAGAAHRLRRPDAVGAARRTRRRAPTGSRRCRRRSRSPPAARCATRSSAGTPPRSRALLGADLGRRAAAAKAGLRRQVDLRRRPARRRCRRADDDPEAMYELGWTDGLPTSRRRPSGSRRCSPAAIRSASLGAGAARDGRGDARAGRGVRRPGRLPARALRRRRGGGRGDARARSSTCTARR